MNATVFDATKEYCTHDIVFSWLPPSCFSQWTPSRFTVEGISYSSGEQFSAAEKKPPLQGPPDVTTHHARVLPSPSKEIWTRSSSLRSRRVGTRARKYCACRLSRQVRPKPSHARTSLGHGRQACRGKLALTTSYGASDTGSATSRHASHRYGAA